MASAGGATYPYKSMAYTNITAIPTTMIATLIANDTVIRWGGEEFLLIFGGCHLEQSTPLAERCQQAIERQVHPEVGVVTVSIGVGELQPEEALSELG